MTEDDKKLVLVRPIYKDKLKVPEIKKQRKNSRRERREKNLKIVRSLHEAFYFPIQKNMKVSIAYDSVYRSYSKFSKELIKILKWRGHTPIFTCVRKEDLSHPKNRQLILDCELNEMECILTKGRAKKEFIENETDVKIDLWVESNPANILVRPLKDGRRLKNRKYGRTTKEVNISLGFDGTYTRDSNMFDILINRLKEKVNISDSIYDIRFVSFRKGNIMSNKDIRYATIINGRERVAKHKFKKSKEKEIKAIYSNQRMKAIFTKHKPKYEYLNGRTAGGHKKFMPDIWIDCDYNTILGE